MDGIAVVLEACRPNAVMEPVGVDCRQMRTPM